MTHKKYFDGTPELIPALQKWGRSLMTVLRTNADIAATVTITLIAFFALFGFRVLDIHNIDLVSRGGDFTVSYLGSVLYRVDEWRWPVFTHMNLAYPYGISVHGTDGSPLLSLIFKVFHKAFGMNPEAQFVGIWMLISYVLQAWVSVLIFRHAFKNKFLITIGALFFVSAPIMMMRVFVHINLMPHFLLLFAILMWMNNRLQTRDWVYMAVLFSLAILTCPYFLPMQTGFFALLIYRKLWVEKTVSWKTVLSGISSLTLLLLAWFYLLGMATTEQEIASGGWRGLALNLTALFNPIWSRSQIFNNLTPKADFDADNYFGFGLLILLIVCFADVKNLFRRDNLKKHAMLALLLAGFFVFALSSQVKLGTAVILDYKPGAYIDWLGSVFRYSGRFFWPIWYLLAFFLIKTIGTKSPKRAMWLLPLLLLVQIWDLYPTYQMKSSFARNAPKYVYPLKSKEWERITAQYDNAFIFAHNKNYAGIWRWAIRNGKNVNYGFLNRPSRKTKDLVNRVREQVLSGYIGKEYADYFFVIDSDLMKKITETARTNPAVAALKNKIKRIDGFDILEYDAELEKAYTAFEIQKIPVKHRYWDTNLIQVSPHRVYRIMDDKRHDYATIVEYNDRVLRLKWDKYGIEEFKKESDGRYHLVLKEAEN